MKYLESKGRSTGAPVHMCGVHACFTRLLFVPFSHPAYWIVLPTIRVLLPSSVCWMSCQPLLETDSQMYPATLLKLTQNKPRYLRFLWYSFLSGEFRQMIRRMASGDYALNVALNNRLFNCEGHMEKVGVEQHVHGKSRTQNLLGDFEPYPLPRTRATV